MADAPAAWAVRTMAPRLCGSSTPSSSTSSWTSLRESYVFKVGIALGGTEGDYALVRGRVTSAIECLSRLEADRHGTFAGQIDDLLKPRPASPPGDQNTVERAPGAQCFPHRMDAGQKAASLAWFVTIRGFALRKLPV